ncbi:MAG: T9SS type A sorting domain-containing protein [Bacteroidia bacterium]
MKTFKWILLLILSGNFFNLSAQQIGDLDSTFNLNGKVITDFGGGGDGANSVLIQPDGKILVAGYSSSGTNYTFALSRYNTNGSLDISFGGTGKVVTDFAPGYDYAGCIALQPDGKIVAAGVKYSNPSYDNALIRYNIDGSLDSTFGTNGKVTNPVGTADGGINSIAIQPDGKIIAVGGSTTFTTGHDYAVSRYNVDGTLDNTFGTGGITLTDFSNSYDFPFSVCLQSDGKIVVGGSTGPDPLYDFGVVRYDTLGNVDTTFGTNGFVVTDFGKPDEWANASIIQGDGKIILAGYSGSPYKFALARYNDDGTLDTTFNSTGKVLTTIGTHVEANAVALEPGGKIVVAGVTYNGSNQNFCIARYLANGTPDNTFGTTGFVTTDFGTNGDKAKGVAIQADGQIVVAGVSGNDFAVARYLVVLSTGIIDFATMNNSVFIYPNPVTQNATLTYSLKQAEKISIRLTDARGRMVKTFIENQMQTASDHQQIISFPDNLPHGTYFIVIANTTEHLNIKIVK